MVSGKESGINSIVSVPEHCIFIYFVDTKIEKTLGWDPVKPV